MFIFFRGEYAEIGNTDNLADVKKTDGVLPIIYAKQHIMWLRAMLGEEVWKKSIKEREVRGK